MTIQQLNNGKWEDTDIKFEISGEDRKNDCFIVKTKDKIDENKKYRLFSKGVWFNVKINNHLSISYLLSNFK